MFWERVPDGVTQRVEYDKVQLLTALNTHPWSAIYSYFWIIEIFRKRKKEQTEANASIVGFEKGWVGGFEKTWLPKSG